MKSFGNFLFDIPKMNEYTVADLEPLEIDSNNLIDVSSHYEIVENGIKNLNSTISDFNSQSAKQHKTNIILSIIMIILAIITTSVGILQILILTSSP